MNSGRTPSHYVHSPRCSVAAASRVIRGGAVCAARVAAAGSRSSRAHLPCLVLRRVPQELAKWPPPLARSGVSERGTTAFRSGPSVHTAAAGAPLAGAWPSRPRGAPPPHAAQSRVSRSQGRALPRRVCSMRMYPHTYALVAKPLEPASPVQQGLPASASAR